MWKMLTQIFPILKKKNEVVDQLEDGEIYELSIALNSETRDYIFSDSQ